MSDFSFPWQKLRPQGLVQDIYVLIPDFMPLTNDFASENWDKIQYLDHLITPSGEHWDVSQRYFWLKINPQVGISLHRGNAAVDLWNFSVKMK